jgi:hypothetical protein
VTKLQLAKEVAKDKGTPAYTGGEQCNRPECSHADWDHMHNDGKCCAPGCKCKEFVKE